MSHRKALSPWEQTVSTRLPHVSRPQAQVLALWSYGMVLAKSCGITTVAALLADLTKTSRSPMRQRLREWCYDAQDKKGEHRQDVDVTLCFAPWVWWILSLWPQDEPRLADGAWMPLRSPIASRCSASACSLAAVPFRSLGS